MREIPLIYQTVKQLAVGNLRVEAGGAFAALPADLTEQVEAEVTARR
jgi:hypothetical protein